MKRPKFKSPKQAALNPRLQALKDLLTWLAQGELKYPQRSAFETSGSFGLYKNLLSQAVRYKNRWMHLTSLLTDRPAHQLDPEVVGAICLGLVQLSPGSGVEPWAAIDESVALMDLVEKPFLKGVVNASLRRYQRDQEALLAGLEETLALGYPKWILSRWGQFYGEAQAKEMALAGNEPPRVWLLPHPELGVEGLAQLLAAQGFSTTLEDGRLWVPEPSGLFESEAFGAGKFLVQDPASQAVAELALPWAKGRVLDACAAPGGKLCHLLWHKAAELEEVIALEPVLARHQRLEENLDRLGLEATLVEAHAEDCFDPQGFDLILADVPCSATGTIGKHPEVKWSRRPQDFLNNQKQQLAILEHLAGMTKPGGTLIYSTCSLEPEENQEVVTLFLERQKGFVLEKQGDQPYLLCLPRLGRGGAFAAVLRRTQEGLYQPPTPVEPC